MPGPRFACLLCLALLCLGGPARAQTACDARATFHIKQGDLAFTEGRYDDAAGQYQQAYEQCQDAHLLFRIGQSQERLGKAQDARKTYEQLLALKPRADYKIDAQLCLDAGARLKDLGGAPANDCGPVTPATWDPARLEQAGDDFFSRGKYPAALQSYEAAQKREPSAVRLYKIGLCQEVMNLPDQAIIAYRASLAADPPLDKDRQKDAAARLCRLEHPSAPVPTRRPKWRIAAGAGAAGAGLVLAGFGISALAVNNQQVVDPPGSNPRQYHTGGIGAGLLVPGLLLLAGGAVAIALPESLFHKEAAASPTQCLRLPGTSPRRLALAR